MSNITVTYNKKMKMSDLIDADYKLLLLLTRLKFTLGFGDKSVDAVCQKYNFDTECFLFLANFQSNKPIVDIHEAFDKLPLAPFLHYLKCSHEYFLENRLPNIRRKLKLIFTETEAGLEEVVLNFFDNYMKEVQEHMLYEDNTVFPYVHSLIDNSHKDIYSINIFEERHNDIEGKMTDLKRILMKYVSGVKDQNLMTNILMELYMSEEELAAHTYIEDNLVIPRVKKIEKQ
ncbi:hemerythrin domain-containing protein [Dysgonomonas macrotermitis]|uniref:Regulator of cell morphogenesis and NO signaling n=1 Tax=Dysgonomonas macrotermitis TaxID=1346286 RepID=A0A1M5A179_9BACT|nr:hemerythrin domain-containing protein [Dysgonomonas macrotermitis]SHF24059.1 regulator of cell morphogenesis and NO signaling [Dysgonomonas macrotermitis]